MNQGSILNHLRIVFVSFFNLLSYHFGVFKALESDRKSPTAEIATNCFFLLVFAFWGSAKCSSAKCCKFVAMRIQKNNMIPENTPHSIAAGIVYFIGQTCKLNLSKRDVNRVSEISEVTINKCYKKLEGVQDKLIPKAILDKYS